MLTSWGNLIILTLTLRYLRTNLTNEYCRLFRELQDRLQEKWISLKGRNVLDCVRIYLTCTRKWPFFGATLYQAKVNCKITPISPLINRFNETANHYKASFLFKQVKQPDPGTVWIAVSEDSVTLLELQTMAVLSRFNYKNIVTFGGCLDDFMLVACPDEGAAEQKLMFSLSKPNVCSLVSVTRRPRNIRRLRK